MTELNKPPADVVIIDPNWTVRRNVRRLLESAGLSVLTLGSLEEVGAALPGNAVASDALLILDVSDDPSIVVELLSRLPPALRRPERTIISTVQPALVDSFCPPGRGRPFAGLLPRPFTPAEVAEIGAAFFSDFAIGSIDMHQAEAGTKDPDWQSLGQRLAQSGNSAPHGTETTRVASGSVPQPQPTAHLTPSKPRVLALSGSGSQPHPTVPGRHDAATVVADAVQDDLRAASAFELETRSVGDLDAVDIELDDSGDQVILEDASAALRAVRELRTDDLAVAGDPVEFYEGEIEVTDEGHGDRAARVQPDLESRTDDGESVDDLDDDLGAHEAVTRDYGPGMLIPQAPGQVADEEIEELSPEFVMAVDDFSDEEPTAVPPSEAMEAVPPPAPAVPAHIIQDLRVEGATRVWPLGDILKHVATRGIQGAIVVSQGEQAFIIIVDGSHIRWAEPLSSETPLDMGSFLLAAGVISDEAYAELRRSGTGDREVVDVLAAKNLAPREPVMEAIAWQVTQHLWQAAALLEGRFRLFLQLEPEHAALAESRPLLQIDSSLALLELYRRFPECLPLRAHVPGERYVTHRTIVEHYLHGHRLLAEEQWVVDALAEPRTMDGLLEMASDHGHSPEQMVGVLARLAELGMVTPMPRV